MCVVCARLFDCRLCYDFLVIGLVALLVWLVDCFYGFVLGKQGLYSVVRINFCFYCCFNFYCETCVLFFMAGRPSFLLIFALFCTFGLRVCFLFILRFALCGVCVVVLCSFSVVLGFVRCAFLVLLMCFFFFFLRCVALFAFLLSFLGLVG